MKPIVIFGAGGFAREVLDLLRDINKVSPQWEIVGFIDDNPAQWGKTLNDLPVLGGRKWLESASPKPSMVLGVGSPVAKRKLALELEPLVADFPTLVHPSVVCSDYVQMGRGVVITAGNVLTNTITLDDFAMLNLLCTVGHDCTIGKYVTASPGVNISGNVHIGEGCDIGTGAKIIPGLRLGEWSIIGAGAVVAKDVPANCTAVGVPAKVIREHPAGWHLS